MGTPSQQQQQQGTSQQQAQLQQNAQKLIDMGFKPEDVQKALNQSKGDFDGAVELLISGNILTSSPLNSHSTATTNTFDSPTNLLFPQVPLITAGPTTSTPIPTVASTAAATTTTTENEQIEKAIKQSLQEKENQEVEKAKQLSRQQGGSGSSTSQDQGPVSMDVDMSMEAAFLLSLKEQRASDGGFSNVFPTQKPNPSIPTGLKNTGNVCYFNSFIQTYFAVPAIRQAVYNLNVDSLMDYVQKSFQQQQQQAFSETSASTSSQQPTIPTQPLQQQPIPAQSPKTAETVPITDVNMPDLITLPISPFESQAVKHEKSRDHKILVLSFMRELQKLFASLQTSTFTFVDPTDLLNALHNVCGTNNRIDRQEDVGEVNLLFLGILEEGLNLEREFHSKQTGTPNSSTISAINEPSLVERLFTSKANEYITGSEADGSNFEVHTEPHFQQMIIPVSKELPTLYESLDSFLCGTVENYTSPKGNKTNANKCAWLIENRLPPILMFQENRVFINPITRTQEKISLPLKFDESIFIDRFCEEHREQTTEIRRTVSNLSHQLSQCEKDRLKYTKYKDRNFSIMEALQSTLEFYSEYNQQQNPPPQQNAENDAVNKCLINLLNQSTERVQMIEQDILELKTLKDSAYAIQDLQRKEYVLFAAWIHGGSPTSGHYRAFIKNALNGKWFEYNDTLVTEVPRETIFSQGEGNPANNVSAYFLIYVQKEEFDKFALNLTRIQPPESLLHFNISNSTLINFTQKMGESFAGISNPLQFVPEMLKQLEEGKLPIPIENQQQGNKDTKLIEHSIGIYNQIMKELEEFYKQQQIRIIPMDLRLMNFMVYLYSSGVKELQNLCRSILLKKVMTYVRRMTNYNVEEVQKELKSVVPDLVQFVYNHQEEEKKYSDEYNNRFKCVAFHLTRVLMDIEVKSFASATVGLKNVWLENKSLDPKSDFAYQIKLASRLVLAIIAYKLLKGDLDENKPSVKPIFEHLIDILGTQDDLVSKLSTLDSMKSIKTMKANTNEAAIPVHLEERNLLTSISTVYAGCWNAVIRTFKEEIIHFQVFFLPFLGLLSFFQPQQSTTTTTTPQTLPSQSHHHQQQQQQQSIGFGSANSA